MVDFLNTAIEVPVWYPVMAVLVGAIVGLVIMLLATWFGGRVNRGNRIIGTTKEAPDRVTWTAPIQISLSSEQRANLESRAKIDGGYHVADLVHMLGVPEREIMRWIRSKKLSLYTDSYRQTWVTAVSVLNLVNELKEGAKAETLSQQPKPASEVVKAATITRGLPPFRQHYWYTVDGSGGRYATLREVLKVAGFPLADRANPDWKKIPAEVKGKIHREKVQ